MEAENVQAEYRTISNQLLHLWFHLMALIKRLALALSACAESVSVVILLVRESAMGELVDGEEISTRTSF